MSDMPAAETVETPAQSPVKAGFTVLLREDGSLVFDIMGEQCGAIELLGLHSYAGTQISNITAMAVGDSKHGMAVALKAVLDKVNKSEKPKDVG